MIKYCYTGIKSIKLPNGEIIECDPTKKYGLNQEYIIDASKIKSITGIDLKTKQTKYYYER